MELTMRKARLVSVALFGLAAAPALAQTARDTDNMNGSSNTTITTPAGKAQSGTSSGAGSPYAPSSR
jgi:hypothetical protein